MLPLESVLMALKIIVAGSIFFVWVVRYENIVKEFEIYGLNAQLRDFVGILKLSSTAMLFSPDSVVVTIGATVITFLMLAAFITHIRVRNPIQKLVPSLTLMTFGLAIALNNL